MKTGLVIPVGMLAVAAFAGPPFHGPAFAAERTAEEAVAFIAFGFEDGMERHMPDGSVVTMAETSRSPASYAGRLDFAGHRSALTLVVRKESDCRYRATATTRQNDTGNTGKIEFAFDFTNLGKVDAKWVPDQSIVRVSYDGAGVTCTSQPDGLCPPTGTTENWGDPDRIAEAVADFRNNVCEGVR